MAKAVYVERWSLAHRLQHALLALAMIDLIITGMAMKYSYAAWSARVFPLLGGFRSTLIIHKFGATLVGVSVIFHVIYLLMYRRRHGPQKWQIMWNRKDFTDAIAHGAHLLGLRERPPQYGRYSYLEKFEYLSIFWGMVVMGGSGLAIWFPALAAQWAPRWLLDGLRVIHSNEAFVAMLALAFGHFFVAHFNPLVFPSSPVWYSGKISAAHLREEHPLEYQQLVEAGKLPAGAAPEHPHVLAGWRRVLGVVEMLIYSAIFYGLLITFIPLLLV